MSDHVVWWLGIGCSSQVTFTCEVSKRGRILWSFRLYHVPVAPVVADAEPGNVEKFGGTSILDNLAHFLCLGRVVVSFQSSVVN